MRPNRLTRTLVSATTVVGIAVGGTLATAGGALAAPEPAGNTAVTAEAVAPLAVVNLGLSRAEARDVQRWLAKYWNYNGSIDGLLGNNSWKSFQRCLRQYWGYNGAIDGIPGPNTIKALQRLLRHYGYNGAIDGDAGRNTRAAFERFAHAL